MPSSIRACAYIEEGDEMIESNRNSLNEELKRRESAERERMLTQVENGGEKVMALDDTQRVKVLSPGRLVSKRFFRNKLALVGLGILIFMFVFSFLGPLFYPYSQTQIFYKYDQLNVDYANASMRTDNATYAVGEGLEVHYSVKNKLNSYIAEMDKSGEDEMIVAGPEGEQYVISKLGEKIYSISADKSEIVAVYSDTQRVATYSRLGKEFTWTGEELDEEFQAAVMDAVASKTDSIRVGSDQYSISESSKNKFSVTRQTPGLTYSIPAPGEDFAAVALANLNGGAFDYNGVSYKFRDNGDGTKTLATVGTPETALVASSYVFDTFETGVTLSDEFKASALLSIVDDGSFTVDGKSYTVSESGGEFTVTEKGGSDLAYISSIVVRRYSGQDSMSIDLKQATQKVVEDMIAGGLSVSKFTYGLPEQDQNGSYLTDENGNVVYADTEITVNRKGDQYVLNCNQITYLIDIYGRPSGQHWFGTDGDGMDILARMMYGGRISLMVGFVVVLLETFLGIIMGGLAGFFGGWVDTLIMRLVDIFYCIPSYPILIIMGSFFDQIKMNPYERLIWLMAILGILGWAGVARLVRGQILSLREQEFMVAEEATGMKARRRIFRHLIPNVMPQLIVNATMGLGSVIITEATLSFLGLGVKHPLATWGTMINSVALSSESMIKYTYIWIPVGLLICLTVIAFNFVGDGLRDAFDPKAKQ
jgi:peptide/nickel transport system permease protein